MPLPSSLWKTTFFGACLIAALPVSGCSDPVETEPETEAPAAFSLRFVATANGKEVGCSDAITGLGPDGKTTIEPSDLRFYVSNLKLLDDAGAEVETTLDDNDFQHNGQDGSVALIDLTSNEDGACAPSSIAFAEGTARTNDVVKGKTLLSKVATVSFDIGVPQKLMKATIATNTPEGAPSPLNEMYWSWATGYRHFVFNFTVDDGNGGKGDGYVHIGSRDCGPADGMALEDRDSCTFVNTPQVRLDDFDLKAGAVQVSLPALVKSLDFIAPIYDPDTFEVIGQGPGAECHSSPMQPDCSLVFPALGLDIDSGKADVAANDIFSAL